VPRNRVLRDETIADMAVHAPKGEDELRKIRNLPRDISSSRFGRLLLEAVKRGLETPDNKCPKLEKKERMPSDLAPVLEMLKMLLRIQASENQVAAKLIATVGDLEALAMNDNANIAALKGWRYEIFGKEALALKHGKISLSLQNNQIQKT